MQDLYKQGDKSKVETTPKSTLWSGKEALVIAIVAYFVAQLVIAIPIVIFSISNGDTSLNETDLGQPWVSLVLSGVSAAGLVATLLLFLRYKKIPVSKLGLKKPKLKSFAVVPVAYFVYLMCLVLVIGIVSAIFTDFNPEQAQNVGYEQAQGWQLLLAFIGLVVIAPIAEEMLFRGFIYKGLKYRSNTRLLVLFGLGLSLIVGAYGGAIAGLIVAVLSMFSAIILPNNKKLSAAIFTSMLFGLVHMQWNVALDTFILSMALIWVVEKTNNLWPAIALHAFKNFIAFVFVFEIIAIPVVGK